MSIFLANVLFALAWSFVTGSFSIPNLVLGFVLGAGALYLIREQIGTAGYFGRIRRVASLIGLFAYELLMSAVKVAKLVLTPRMDLQPGIFAYPAKLESDMQVTLLANLITLTPGTLTVDTTDDGSVLYVHAIDCSDVEGTRRDIASGFEHKIREAFR
jgi:multicomponent Na+:H+ antiporter subunit E